MIAYRLLESLSHACTKQVNHIMIKVHHYEFRSGSKIVNKGWRAIKGILSDNENSNNKMKSLQNFRNSKSEMSWKYQNKLLEKQRNTKLLQKRIFYQRWKMREDIYWEQGKNNGRSMGIGTPLQELLLSNVARRIILSGKAKPCIPLIKAYRFYNLVKTKK